MIEIAWPVINEWLTSHILVFSRIAGMISAMAVIGTRNISPRIKLFLAIAITVIALPTVKKTPVLDLFSLSAFIHIALQVMIGIAIGFVSRLVFETFIIAGQIIAMQTGLGFASLVNPSTGASVPALGQMFVMIMTLIFLGIDGHLQLIELIVKSFETLPIHESSIFFVNLKFMVDWAAILFSTAFMMSLSAIVALLMVNLTFGVMSRSAPQINIFVIGFPMMTLAGLIIIWMIIKSFIPYWIQQHEAGISLVCRMIFLECGNG